MDRRLVLKDPDPREMTGCFDAARQWIATLRAAPHVRVEIR